MSIKETVLFTIDKNNECRIGLPPHDPQDNYDKRAMRLGKLEGASHIVFNTKGEMFAVRGNELFRGPTPNTAWNNWFELATCVGRGVWDQCKFLFFDPSGKLWIVTTSGGLYKGPEPNNENVPWAYKIASKAEGSKWNAIQSMFFDPEGNLHTVFFGELRRSPALLKLDGNYIDQSICIGQVGWDKLNYFIDFSSDGKLWCVASDNGNMLTGDPPTARTKNDPWKTTAKNMKGDFRIYKQLSFTQDKTIVKVLNVEFLTDVGKVLSLGPEVVTEEQYDNRDSTNPLKCTFEVNKTYELESSFGHEHGMEIGMNAETTFEAKLPFIGKSSTTLSLSTTITNNISFTKVNKTATAFTMKSEFELEPGKAVRQSAIAKKANMDVPYKAEVLTLFGCKETISGTWTSACMFDMRVVQMDMK